MKFRSDHPHDFDFVVYGAGFSGVGAALELGQSGYRVGIIETAGEVPIRGTNLVLPTPLNQSVDSGPNIDQSIDTLLFPENNIWPFVDRGECLQVDDSVVVGHDPFTGKNSWTAKHLVFAHPGQNPDLPSYLSRFKHRFGYRISFDAWSDSYFFKNKNICMVGSGFHALDQARWASGHVAEISLFCEENTFCEKLEFFERSWVPDNCTIYESVTDIAMQENGDEEILIRATRHQLPIELRVDGIFWVPDLVSGQSLLEDSFNLLQDRDLITLVGIDNGVAYWDFNNLYLDGRDAARQLVQRLGAHISQSIRQKRARPEAGKRSV